MLTALTLSLRRYASHDANSDGVQNTAATVPAAVPVVSHGSPAQSKFTHNGSATTDYASGSASTGHATDAMADLHLSGSDPRMFPGILTREQRSGSLKNLAHAYEKLTNNDGSAA